MVAKALRCIADHLDDIQDSYTISLVTYTLLLADHPKADLMMTRLKKKAINSEGLKDCLLPAFASELVLRNTAAAINFLGGG